VHNDIEEILYTEEQLQARVRDLGQQITKDYAGQELVLLAVLRGAIVFLADLSRNINLHCVVDFLVVEKVYSPDGESAVKIIKDLDASISGRHVIIVEDIIDEGKTLTYLVEALKIRRPASLKVVTIFDKPARRVVPFEADYVGFEVPDRFVVGYGLDHKQRFRNLPCLGVLRREAVELASAGASSATTCSTRAKEHSLD
jgi:hypoxanthine phosphoribosyltransferase